jgi:Predicted membrane protein involved in D-alanine export
MFTIIGLWHGADWTLVIWGCLNGFFIVYETMATRWLKKLPGDKSWMKTKAWHYIRVFKGWSFSMLGALFFRAHNVDDAITLLARSTYLGQTSFYPRTFFTNYGMAIFVILVMDLMNRRMGKNMIHQHMKKEATWFRWSFYIFITYLVLYYGINNSMEFIYFDF